jgi:hypothetical protein
MRAFLTAEWRYLLMLNYAIEPRFLRAYVPQGVELDDWNGTTYVSMVGFLFQQTRVKGWRIPGHVNFEEVNLRFYVRRQAEEGWRRGVVFIREIVPRPLIATIAKICYEEPYLAMPMRHRIGLENGNLRDGAEVKYEWRHQDHWDSLSASVVGNSQIVAEGSEEEFITEHYWGYTQRKNGGCSEYKVEHPHWTIWRTRDPALRCDVASLYGEEFAEVLAKPKSAFVAEGSAVTVYDGARI